MNLFKSFLIFVILIIKLAQKVNSSALDSLLSPKPLKFSLIPEVVFKLTDKVNPDFQ